MTSHTECCDRTTHRYGCARTPSGGDARRVARRVRLPTTEPRQTLTMPHQSYSSAQRKALIPFALCAVAALATLAPPPYGHEWGHMLAATGLLAVILVAESTMFGRSGWQAVPP